MLSEVRDLRQKRSVVATLPSEDTCGQPRLQHAFLFPVSPFKMIVMARWGGGGGGSNALDTLFGGGESRFFAVNADEGL